MSGLAALWSDLKENLFPAVAYAEDDDSEEGDEVVEDSKPDAESAEDEGEETGSDDDSKDDSEDGDDSKESDEDSEESDGEDEDDEDEDEDEDEVKDPLDTLREQYTEGVCHPFKHHFEECVARVKAQQEEPDYADWDYKEDCVEEFFHLHHCLDENIAPVLFSKLK